MASPPSCPRWRSCGNNCLCWLCMVIVFVVFVGATVIICLYIRESTAATVVSATLSRFDLTDGPSGGGTLQYNLTVDIRVRNRKRGGSRYDHDEAQASYDAERFGYDTVEPFYLEGKSERTITAAFSGSSPVYDANTMRTYRRERSEGFYFISVRIYYQAEVKVRYSAQHIKMKIRCTLRLPVPNQLMATPVTTQLETTCDARY